MNKRLLLISPPFPLSTFFTALLCFPLGAIAATPTVSDEADLMSPVVVVASRVEEPLAQVVSSVAVITRDEIERRLEQDTADVVRYVPGLRVDSDGNRFGNRGFVIRGLGGNQVRTEIDGVSLPDTFKVGQYALANRDLINLGALEQIEVMRGPASTLYGSDALAGIVVLRTRRPADMLEGQPYRLNLRTDYNSRNDSHLLGISGAIQGSEKAQTMLLASRREGHATDNMATRPVDTPNPSDFRDQAFLARFDYDAGSAGQWNILLDHYDQSRQSDIHSLRLQSNPPTPRNDYIKLLADDSSQRDRLSVEASWENPFAGVNQLSIMLYGQETDVEQTTKQWLKPTTPPAPPSTPFRWRFFEYNQKDYGLNLLAQSRWQTDALSHWLVYGIEQENTRYEGFRDGLQTNLNNGTSTNIILGENLPTRDFPNSNTARSSIFIQDEISWGKLAVIPALRFEHYRLEAKPDALFRKNYPTLAVASIKEDSVTPRLGLRFALSPHQHVFLQAAEGFRAPPFSDVNIALKITAATPYEVRSNPNLKPEKSRGLEAGWRWQGEAVQAAFSVFDNRYKNLIESRINIGVDPITGFDIFQSVNRQRARIKGVELETTLRPGIWFETLTGWQLNLAASTTRGEDTIRNQPLNSLDPDRLVLGIRYDNPSMRWGTEFVTTATSRLSRVDKTGATIPFVPPGYVTFDAFAWVAPWKDGRLSLGLQNLGNHRYWEWGGVQNVAATAANIGFFSRPSFNVSVGFSQSW